jgi:hypothetical protein
MWLLSDHPEVYVASNRLNSCDQSRALHRFCNTYFFFFALTPVTPKAGPESRRTFIVFRSALFPQVSGKVYSLSPWCNARRARLSIAPIDIDRATHSCVVRELPLCATAKGTGEARSEADERYSKGLFLIHGGHEDSVCQSTHR